MTPKERVLAALRLEKTDIVPLHHVGISSDVASAILGHEAYVGGGIQQWREAAALWKGPDAHAEFIERSYRDAIDIGIATSVDLIRPSYWRATRQPTRRLDDYTFLYEYGTEEEWRVLRFDPGSEQCDITYYKPQPEASLETVEREVVAEEAALRDYRLEEENFAFEIRAQKEMGNRYEIRCGGVSVGIPLRGVEIWMEALILRPDLVARHLDVQVEQARRNVESLSRYGFKHYWGGLDFASNEGPMFSPKIFRELVLPRLQAVSEICHRYGALHFFASDGEFWSVADDLFGKRTVDGYYEIDHRAGMTLRKLRQHYPQTVLIGDISSHTVHLGTKEQIRAEAEEALAVAKEKGGIIAGLSNQFVPHTPVDNVLFLLQVLSDNR